MLPILSYVQHYKKYHAARFEAASVQYGLNQLEIDILLFLHNNPDCRTASDICRYRGLAKSNVSAAVERLRARGVLTVCEVRTAVSGRSPLRRTTAASGCWALRPMPCRWSRYWRTSSAAAWSRCLRALRRRSSRRCRTICAAWMQISCGS